MGSIALRRGSCWLWHAAGRSVGVHRHFSIVVSPGATDGLVAELRATAGVVRLSVLRGASVQPPGDVVSVEALNRGADAVLLAVQRACDRGSLSVSTSQVSSLSDSDHAVEVDGDIDESTWEDATTALRHHSQVSVNFVALMVLGGVWPAAR
jgi:hypothetical protein